MNEIKYIITMDHAFTFLENGLISEEEFQVFMKKMTDKYDAKKDAILYQTKLDMLRTKSVNTCKQRSDTK